MKLAEITKELAQYGFGTKFYEHQNPFSRYFIVHTEGISIEVALFVVVGAYDDNKAPDFIITRQFKNNTYIEHSVKVFETIPQLVQAIKDKKL